MRITDRRGQDWEEKPVPPETPTSAPDEPETPERKVRVCPRPTLEFQCSCGLQAALREPAIVLCFLREPGLTVTLNEPCPQCGAKITLSRPQPPKVQPAAATARAMRRQRK